MSQPVDNQPTDSDQPNDEQPGGTPSAEPQPPTAAYPPVAPYAVHPPTDPTYYRPAAPQPIAGQSASPGKPRPDAAVQVIVILFLMIPAILVTVGIGALLFVAYIACLFDTNYIGAGIDMALALANVSAGWFAVKAIKRHLL